MIPGWEDYTEEINEEQMPKVYRVASGLKNRVGKDNAITNKKIRIALKAKEDMVIGDAEMRKIIQFIRQNQLVSRLCSTGTGYYVAATDEEWLEWLESYKRRTNSMIYTLKCSIQGENMINFDQTLKKL